MPRQEPYAYSYLPLYFNGPDSDLNGLGPFEQRSRIEERHQQPSVLREVPLLLLPQQLFALSRAQRQRCPETISALKAWLLEARADDQRLRIRRPWIPFVEAYFPDSEAGRKTYQMAKEIGNVPRQCGINPNNQNQRFWLKTLHYLWQAKGVLLAQQLSQLPTEILQANIDNLNLYLPGQSMQNAAHIAEADLAFYQAINQNFDYLKTTSLNAAQQKAYSNPWNLFIAIQVESFQTGWKIGPAGSEINGVSQDQQREYLHTKSYLIENRPWLEGKKVNKGLRLPYHEDNNAFINYLKRDGLRGQIILALRSKPHSAELEDYAKSMRKHKDAYLDDFQWRNGQPYKYKVTSSPKPAVAETDAYGYILWCWH